MWVSSTQCPWEDYQHPVAFHISQHSAKLFHSLDLRRNTRRGKDTTCKEGFSGTVYAAQSGLSAKDNLTKKIYRNAVTPEIDSERRRRFLSETVRGI